MAKSQTNTESRTSLVIDEKLLIKAQKQAKREGMSASRWIASLIADFFKSKRAA